jgi:hypothetical protein
VRAYPQAYIADFGGDPLNVALAHYLKFGRNEGRTWSEEVGTRDLYLAAKDVWRITAAQLDQTMGWVAGSTNAWARANNLPEFAVGTNYVPQDMLAQVHEGERIIPAADNAALFAMLNDGSRRDDVLVAEIKALRAEVARLRTENMAAQTSIATNTRKSAQALEQWDADGMPEVRS